jgi:hypothetical protein
LRTGVMAVSWAILAPVIALAITLAAMQVAVVLTGTIRSHDYRRFEDKSRVSLARRFPLPVIDRSAAEQRRKSVSPFLDKAHKAATAAQTTYYAAVVRSAGCLVVAFLSLALGTIRPADWPAWIDRPFLESVLSWIDAIAIMLVLILFLYGRMVCRPWIARRAGAELLRQYQFVSLVFPNAISPAPADDDERPSNEADLIAGKVEDGSITDIVSRIEKYWLTRKAFIESRTLADGDLTADAVLVYLQRRVRRQLGWFTDSKARLEHIAERRNILLLSLYCVAAALALVKHILFLSGGRSPAYLLPLLVIVTGMSAAMTASYVNQNSRSLIHRYNTQQRFITAWLTMFNERWNFEKLPSLTIDPAAKGDMRAQILRFEDLMIEELIDWIHITSHDAIELAP